MLGVSNYGAFVLAFLILLLIPGPGNFALITSTGKGGVRAGLAATVGVILGDQVLMWLAVAGVASLLKAYPAAFHLVQWMGAAYLLYLGSRLLFARSGGAMPFEMKARQYLRQTMIITLFNPKAILFYMAFFPLFIDPAQHPGVLTFAFMAVTVSSLTFLYGLVVVLLTHFFAEKVRSSRTLTTVLEKVAGMFLIGFGIRVAIQ